MGSFFTTEDLDQFAGRKYTQLSPPEQEKFHDVVDFINSQATKFQKWGITKDSKVDDITKLELEDLADMTAMVQEMDDTPADQEVTRSSVSKAPTESPKPKPTPSTGMTAGPSTGASKPMLPSATEGQAKTSAVTAGLNKAAELAQRSRTEDREVDPAKDSKLDSTLLKNIEVLASSPVPLQGAQLDQSLAKIVGDRWKVPSVRDEVRRYYTVYSVLK
jgi:hypothetical protein